MDYPDQTQEALECSLSLRLSYSSKSKSCGQRSKFRRGGGGCEGGYHRPSRAVHRAGLMPSQRYAPAAPNTSSSGGKELCRQAEPTRQVEIHRNWGFEP